MKSVLPLSRCWLKLACLVCGFSVLTSFSQAQSASTGIVQGRVFNPSSQEYIRNAEVRLEGTNQVTYTESDGTFSFRDVAPGQTTITVTYSGYTTAKETFTVSAGQTAVREINLTSTAAAPGAGKDGVVQLQAFTVSSEREGNSKAVADQRRNMDITNTVSADIFGDVADGNIGEFLKYLPGVDLDYVESEARGPRLGGMDSQYVGVSFDGIRTASADANRGGGEASRATSFEGFAITSIESIEVNLTTSAESDADSPAGTINMRTKRAFDRKGRLFGYNFGVNFNAEEMTINKKWGPDENRNYKWKPNYQLEYSESFFQQRFGVRLGVSRANSYTEQYSFSNDINRNPIASDPRPQVIRSISIKDGPKEILKDTMTLTMDFRATRNLVLSFNAIYNYTEGEFWNRNFDFIAANDNANVNNGRHRALGDTTTVYTERTATNTVPAMNIAGGSSSKLTYNRTFAPRFEYKIDGWVIDGAITFSDSLNNYEALERGFTENEALNIPSNWIATRPHPASWEWTIRQVSGPNWFSPESWAGGTRVESSGREWLTEIWNGQLNARWTLPFMRAIPTAVKFGGKWNEETRDNRNEDTWRIWRYVGPGGDTVTYNATTGQPTVTASGNWANLGFIAPHEFDTGNTNGLTVFNIEGIKGMPPRADRNKIATLFREHPELFAHASTADNYYNAFITPKRDFRQTITSGYSQADFRLRPQLQLRAGIRWERTENELTEWNPRTRDEVVAAGFPINTSGRATSFAGLEYQYQSQPRVTRRSQYDNYFPSASLKYRILPDLEFQAGFNKTISRPPIDHLTGLWVIIEDAAGNTNRIEAPNPDVMPEHSKKYMTRLAYYFGSRAPGQLSLTLSQNDIRNLREERRISAEAYGIDDPEFADYEVETWINSPERRRFRNLSLSYNQTLGFLPDRLRGLNTSFTYDRSYASQRRNKLAPHRVTSRLGYAYRRFSGNIGMIWIHESPDGSALADYGRFNGERTQFDLTLNWKLARYATLYVQGRNITGKPVTWYESPIGQPEGSSPILRQFQEYGANWVFGVKGQF
jgi:iron complex outermembrane recepter protein